MAEDRKTAISVCTVSELEPGERRVVEHDGELDSGDCTIECPRHGSIFDLRSGKPKTVPAFQPVQTFPVEIVDGIVTLMV